MINNPVSTRKSWRTALYTARPVSLFLTALMCPLSAHAADQLYWTQIRSGSKGIVRADLNGANDVFVVSTTDGPTGIAFDAAHPEHFFVMIEGTTDQIFKFRIDGSSQELVVSAPESSWIAIDSSAGHVYWSRHGLENRGLRRSNLDGSDMVELLSGFVPTGIALDLQAGKIYWCRTDQQDPKHVDRIQRANLDGTGVEDLVDGCSLGMALDVSAGKMYWTELNPKRVRRANLDGTGSEDVATGLTLPPVGIALDPARGKIYWTGASASGGTLHRANLDGTNVELLRFDLDVPVGITLVPVPDIPAASAWGLLLFSLVILIVGSLRIGARHLRATRAVR